MTEPTNLSRSGASPGAFVSCPDLDDGLFRQALREIKAARDEPSRMGRALQLIRYELSWHIVLWHVARHRLVSVEDNQPLLGALAECAVLYPDSSPDLSAIVAEVLARLPDERDHGLPSGWTENVDNLVFATYRHDAEPFLERRATYAPRVRCALDFVRGRAGSPLDDDERAAVFAMLLAQAGSVGLTPFGSLWWVDENGEEQELSLKSAEDVRVLASRFGGGTSWDDGLLAEARRNRWARLEDVLPVLIRLPLAELVSLLLPRQMSVWPLSALLSARTDGDDELRDAAASLPNDACGAWLRHGLTEVVKARTTPPRQLCNVALLTAGPNRMGLIKLLATKSPFGVQAARAAVDAPPAECPEPMPIDAARALAAAVQELGGTLELKNVREVPGHIVSDPSPGG